MTNLKIVLKFSLKQNLLINDEKSGYLTMGITVLQFNTTYLPFVHYQAKYSKMNKRNYVHRDVLGGCGNHTSWTKPQFL